MNEKGTQREGVRGEKSMYKCREGPNGPAAIRGPTGKKIRPKAVITKRTIKPE